MASCDVPDALGTTQGQGRAARGETELQRQREKGTLRRSITAGRRVETTPASLSLQLPGLQTHRTLQCQAEARNALPPRAPLGLPHGDPVARAGKFPQPLAGHFLARITAVLTLGRLGLGTPHCCHKATGSAGICKYRLPPTGVMSSAQC